MLSPWYPRMRSRSCCNKGFFYCLLDCPRMRSRSCSDCNHGFSLAPTLSPHALWFRLQSWIFIGSHIICSCALVPAAIMDFHCLPHYLRMRSGSGCNHGFSLAPTLSAHELWFRLQSRIFIAYWIVCACALVPAEIIDFSLAPKLSAHALSFCGK